MDVFGFEQDSNTIVCGPTSSGKTTLLLEIFTSGSYLPSDDTQSKTPSAVYILCPPETTSSYVDNEKTKDIKVPVNFVEGTEAAVSFLNNLSTNDITGVAIAIDDLGSQMQKREVREAIEKLFHVTTHHKHLWTFFVTHDLFGPGLVSCRRNTQNFILFNLLNDKVAASTFISKLIGRDNLPVFLDIWKHCLDVHPAGKGFIRLDQRLRGHTHQLLTGNGIQLDRGGLIFQPTPDAQEQSLF
jgi:hypothetical protein